MTKPQILIVGGSSAIALAIAKLHIEKYQVIIVSRAKVDKQFAAANNIRWLNIANYQEDNIAKVAEQIALFGSTIAKVFICNGMLHGKDFMPEKRLEDIDASVFSAIISSNTLTPLLWLKYLTPIITAKHPCKVVVFSARVGSISDNQLGGWYSYRASKAALNMLLKTAAIELARRAKNVKVMLFHPGTTDTELSKPFQHNVAKGKLFMPEFVAHQLMSIVDELTLDGEVSYLDWQGQPIAW